MNSLGKFVTLKRKEMTKKKKNKCFIFTVYTQFINNSYRKQLKTIRKNRPKRLPVWLAYALNKFVKQDNQLYK